MEKVGELEEGKKEESEVEDDVNGQFQTIFICHYHKVLCSFVLQPYYNSPHV